MIGDFLKAQDNREIKFRAWVCGDYYDWEMVPAESLTFGTHAPLAHFLKDGAKKCVMQYTGLKDAEGTEIYEGDILEGIIVSGQNFLGIVARGEARWVLLDRWHINPVNVRHYAESSKVVGNVFENPELLEGVDE